MKSVILYGVHAAFGGFGVVKGLRFRVLLLLLVCGSSGVVGFEWESFKVRVLRAVYGSIRVYG